ncbi:MULTISPECIES: S41 family peptidase [Thalassobaculum]|uniref:Carboxyl-terminal processing protease n=1 Tax=Thalassobaculum litoreum DSM 18839 TaxID=1123362 RepID=A0A8G2BMJ8_9PROT|nr:MULTISPECIES: S41 family peptidase [Thalassobaculum]SDG23647.1 carboxyl-terminal processing protease [Thalassobaculum litoreum DSM 18839]
MNNSRLDDTAADSGAPTRPDKARSRAIRRVAVSAALAFAVGGGVLLGATGGGQSQTNSTDTYRQLSLLGDVFEKVRAQYVEEVSDEKLVEAAINGMLTSLDPHSSYLSAKSFQDMRVQTKGEFGGLGIEVTMENGFVKVVSPIDDTPASEVGLQPGDYITHLDGEAVLGLTLSDAVEKMRGKVGTPITLTIRRAEEEPFDVEITRAIITIKSVRNRVIQDIGYIRITTFNEQTTVGLQESVSEIKEELGDRLHGFVIDLRNNPGGLLDQAISVTDAFLERGEIVSTRGREEANASRVNATPGDITDGKPVVVLINGGSASASEIVAGALQDHRRAIVLGTQSFGKGSVQTILPLQGNAAMRLTTARYYTPSGRSIQAKGIEPDIKVELAKIEKIEEGRRRREADLRGALVNPDESDAPAAQPPAEVPTPGEAASAENEDPLEDYQLARAVDLLRGFHLFQNRVVN